MHKLIIFVLLVGLKNLVFAQDTTLTVTPDGLVGIGTTQPSSRLHVKASGIGWQDHVILEGNDDDIGWNILVDSG